jgi:hypothetical protein
MADFFKGLSGGFQTGLQISEALRAKQERERLREAMGLTPQEMQQRQATPEELGRAQAETQGLAAQDAAMFGLGPQEQAAYAPQMPVEGQRIGATQYGLGGQTFSRMPTQQEIETARYGAAANVIAERDPMAAMRMRREMEDQAYQAQRRPLELAGLERQAKLGDLQLTDAERTAATAKRMDAFNTWRSQNPQADFATINAEVQRLGMGVDEQFKVASSLTGIGEQEFKASQQRIQKLVKNQGLDGLLKAHKESNDLDPGSHFEVIRGKGGAVSLNRVDTATGQVIQPNVFSGSEAETTAYLNKAAMDPATIIDYTMNLEKSKAAIAASKASTAKDNSLAARYARDEPEKGLTKKINEMEAVLGRKMTTAEKETALGLINKPRDEKPQKVEEAGVQYKVDGKLVQTDGMGGFISTKGILPTDRPAALKAAGISDNNLSRVLWSNDGEAVMFNNEEFDIRDKRDAAKLNKALTEYDTMNRKIAEEARLRSNPTGPSGFQGARTTGLGPTSSYGAAPGAQSIYGR